MWLQRFTHFLQRSHWRAVALTFVIGFVPVFNVISILIAAFFTLSKGIAEGAIFTLAATLPYFVSFAISDYSTSPNLGMWAAISVAVLSNLLTYAFAVMLRRQASFSVILQVAALFGVFVISLVHLAYPSVADWWGHALQTYYAQAQAAVQVSVKPLTDARQLEAINATKWYATGSITAIILVSALTQLVMARWWQTTLYNPHLLRRELRNIRLTSLAGILFVTSLAMFFYWGNSVIIDIMPVLYALFCAAGLSLIHYLFGLMQSPTAWFWLLILYFTLLFLMPASIVLVAILALIDICIDVRRRVTR